MERELEIRAGLEQDRSSIEALYPKAFPDEDLLPLVRELLGDPAIARSLVAAIDSAVIGNIIFTRCGVDGCSIEAAMLAPLGVDPGYQGQGVGSALVRAGLRRMQEEGTRLVFVLGDPAYYSRLGFRPEHSVATPYPLPPDWTDAWQSRPLGDSIGPVGGKLSLPGFWLDPALWSG